MYKNAETYIESENPEVCAEHEEAPGAGRRGKRFIERCIADGTVELKSAVHSSSTGIISVNADVNRMLSPERLGIIEQDIREALCGNKIEVNFNFRNALDSLLSNDDKACEALLKLWCEISPQLAPILKRSRAERQGGEYIFFVPARFIKAMGEGAAAVFRDTLAHTYGRSIALRVVPDAALNDGMDKAEPVIKYDTGIPPQVKSRKAGGKPKPAHNPGDIIFGREILKPDVIKMADITDRTGRTTVVGSVIDTEGFVTQKRGTVILTAHITDRTDTVTIKLFPENKLIQEKIIAGLEKVKEEGDAVTVRGFYRYDNYSRDYCLFADDINRCAVEKRTDTSPEKRVELHLHTQMSAMDATTKVSEVIARAAKWGHKAIAVTDHGVVYSFPEAKKAAKKYGIKVIFGCEGYLLPDCGLIPIPERFCALAVTGVGKGALGRVFEIAVLRFKTNGDNADNNESGDAAELFRTPVNPGVPIPAEISELTGLSAGDIYNAPTLPQAVKAAADFIGDDVLIVRSEEELSLLSPPAGGTADNAGGERNLSSKCVSVGLLAHYLERELNGEEREAVPQGTGGNEAVPQGGSENKTVPQGAGENKAVPQCMNENGCGTPSGGAEACVRALRSRMRELIKAQKKLNITSLPLTDCAVKNREKQRTSHIILLAATQPGLKNLYKLISYSNLEHFYKTPRIPRSLLNIYRQGIILGSACESGELYRAVAAGRPEEELLKIADWYDYLEIQPTGNNAFMLREGYVENEETLRDYNRHIVELGEKLNKPVAATGDVHFLEPEDSVFRAILMSSAGFKDAEKQPPLFFRTTGEMLKEFEYLGREKAFETVVENPNKIADMCDSLRPFLDDKKTYSPELPGAAEELKRLTESKARALYGEILPDTVRQRLDKELNSIIGNGYSSLYMVAQKLVAKSLGDGYLVGSRGSVGSSFAAYTAGITEVNALPPHYRCPKCKYSEFPKTGGRSECGMDLPPKNCPNCGTPLIRDGYNIPFETFLGFKGDKTPDIDLNFSGEYQPVAHKFTEDMFGHGHAFRAGTISGIKDKTAYGFVMHYCEKNGLNPSEAEKNRLAQGCVGTRRTTGQHPGGIVIVPKGLEVYDFCPVQHPAEKTDAESVTTHFDFHALDDKLVKLDILGHDDPTSLRMLQDITGIDPKTISLSDEETMSLFKSEKTLGISLSELDCGVGSLGIPEFGTAFVRGMLMDTRPTTMEELIRISGLSHGENVWLNNAQELVRGGVADLTQVICTRDDIMNYLIAHGGEPSLSFKTMESVRKGRGLTPEMEEAMHKNNVPEWYIESCKKIKYMFPRAHAAAYVMMAFRIAYFKVHHPLAFYSVYLTIEGGKFDIMLCMGGADKVLANIREIKKKPKPEPKDDEQVTILEVVYEMNLRGIELLPVDIYKSKATKFTVEDGKLRPPFNTVTGLGNTAAELIEKAAGEGRFISREDFALRTKANIAVIAKLDEMGCLEEFPESNQVSMF